MSLTASSTQSAQGLSEADAEKARQAALARQRTRVLGQVVALLTRSANHQHMTVAEIRSQVLPPVLNGQVMLAGRRFRRGDLATPVAAIAWACVSKEVDQRLLAASQGGVEMSLADYKSGDIVWVTEVIGDVRAFPQMVARLRETEWKDKTVRLSSRAEDGSRSVRTLDPA